MQEERFKSGEEALTAPVDPEELHAVLHDLSSDPIEERRALKELPDDHVTAQAIAETLDLPLEDVYGAIARVRHLDVREHVSKVLRELEEPTHRVERPGHPRPDALDKSYGWRREDVFSSILDRLPGPGRTKQAKREHRPSKVEEAVGNVILIAVGTGIVGLIVYGLAQMGSLLR